MTSPKTSPKNKADLTSNGKAFRLLFSNHPIPMWIYDLKTLAFLEVNNAALEKYGYARDEFLEMTIKDIRPSEDIKHLTDNLSQKRPALEHSGEWRHRLKNGQVIDVEITSHTLDFEGHKAALVVAQDITGHKQAEKALRDSELRFRSLIEHGLDNISLLAADGSLLWESPAVVHALGYEYDQFKGRNIFELTHPDDMERAQLRFKEIISKPGNVIHGAFRLKHSNGSWRWMEGTGTNLLHVPSINAVVINYRDITESKQAEDFLQESARSLAHAQRIGKLGDWDWDVEGNSLTWSDEIYRIWGVGKDFPLTFDSIAGMIHPDDREMNLKAVLEFLASRDEGEFEFRIICPDGTIKYIYQSIEVTRGPDGQPIKVFGIMQDITKRRRVEEALRVSEERLRLANKATNDVIWDWDIVNDSQRWNEAGTVVFGWSDIVESPQPATWWVERVHPEDRQRVENSFFAVTAEPARNYWHDEYRFRKMDGSYAQVIDRGYVLRNAQGEAVRMIGAMLDITERKQMEGKIKESLSLLRIAEEAAKLGGWSVDLETNRATWSNEVEAIHEVPAGFSPSVEEGINFYAPEWHERISKVFSDCAQHGIPYNEEMEIITAKGKRVWVQTIGEAVRDNKGKIIKVQGAFQDITERKQTEENLIVSEVRYRRLFEAARDGILILDAETGMIIDVNPFLSEMLGFSHEEICGKELWELGYFKDIAESKSNFLELQQKGYIRYDDLPLEIANGRKFHVEFISNVYNVNHHKVIQCNIRDITERKQAEQKLAQYSEHLEEMVEERTSELREAQEKLVRQEKLAVLGQLAGGVGHELRNPLAVINNAL